MGAALEMTFLKARSKSLASGDASTSRAIATKRVWRSASVSFGFVLRLLSIVLVAYTSLQPTQSSAFVNFQNGDRR